jgi:site-specific DNA-methyltransferase (adenine-specific)/modification methylase
MIDPNAQWQIITGDCLEVMKHIPEGMVGAVVTDPPYGISLSCANEESGGVGRQAFERIAGDDKPFNPTTWLSYPDVFLFGCNHYCNLIPPHEGQWYFWDKTLQNNQCRIAEGEFIWHKQGTKPRAFRHLWSGAYRASESGVQSEHPTQKPVKLMEWCLSFLPAGCTVLDPYCGSGTTGVACIRTGRRFIGIELDPKYADIARRRCAEAEPVLFTKADKPEEAKLWA